MDLASRQPPQIVTVHLTPTRFSPLLFLLYISVISSFHRKHIDSKLTFQFKTLVISNKKLCSFILTTSIVYIIEFFFQMMICWTILIISIAYILDIVILPTRTPDIIAHWQVAPPARPPSRWLSHMFLTEPCCCFPDIPNMEWHNKNIFWYNIYNTNIHI